MPVDVYDSQALFTLRIVKHLQSNPDRKWANTYEFRANNSGDPNELLALATQLVNFEAAIHFDQVVFDRVLISTWQPDSKPYDPTSFIVSTLTATGEALGAADTLPLNMCLSVARQSLTGRLGHVFYRGCLDEDDVNSPAGDPVLVSKAGLQARISTALTSSGIEDSLPIGFGGNFSMVMIGKTDAEVRLVQSLRVSGVSVVPVRHTWFNRTPSGGSGAG